MNEQSFEIEVLGEKYRGHYIKSVAAASDVLEYLSRDNGILKAIDTETEPLSSYAYYPKAALSPHLSRIRLLQVFDGRNSCVFDLRYLQECGARTVSGNDDSERARTKSALIKFLEENRFVGHNSVFDLQYFIKMGVKDMNIGCTLLLAKLLNHATSPVDIGLSLELLVEKVLGIEVNKGAQKSDWSGELTFEQIQYAALDPLYTYLLAEKLAPGLKKYGLERIYKLYKDAQHVVAKMQLNGLAIDVEAHRENIARWREELYVAKEDVLELTELKKLTGATLASWLEENLDAETLSLWPKTETGRLKTDSHVFSDFSHLPIAEKFERYQKLDKLISAFGDRLIAQINPETKRLHASYKIAGARTGRMSCANPNLQQSVRDDSFRRIFIPPKEYSFIVADYNQIELRVAAELSQDKKMLSAYQSGQDIHAITAANMTRKPLSSVTKEDRQRAKAVTFGSIYGIGSKTLKRYAKQSYNTDIDENQAGEIIRDFRDLYCGYWDWFLQVVQESEKTLKVKTPLGKLRRLNVDSTYGASANTKIQGGAAEVMMEALRALQSSIDAESADIKIVSCVHDEISIVAPKAYTEEAATILECSMLDGFLRVFPKGVVKGLVKATFGENWAEAKA